MDGDRDAKSTSVIALVEKQSVATMENTRLVYSRLPPPRSFRACVLVAGNVVAFISSLSPGFFSMRLSCAHYIAEPDWRLCFVFRSE